MDLRERPAGDFVRHPWETARFEFFAGLVEEIVARRSGRVPLRVLDAGSGDAWFASRLIDRLDGRVVVTGWDSGYSEELLRGLAADAPAELRLCTARPDGRFDLLLVLDVLEHVEDAAAFLRVLVADNLAPDGWALLSVPAWPWLVGQHDRDLAHYRRYTPGALRALAEESGLRVRRAGGLFSSLLVARVLAVLLERARRSQARSRAVGGWPFGARSARLVHGALRVDATLSRVAARWRVGLPGLSCWAACERSR